MKKKIIRHGNSKFNEGHYVEAYILSRQGLKDKAIESALGLAENTLKRWLKKYPYLQKALDRGRAQVSKKEEFKQFVVGRLPEHLMDLWEEIQQVEDGNSQARMDALLNEQGTRSRQYLFIHALINTNFRVSAAKQLIGITLEELNKWKKDSDFTELLEVIHQVKKDFVEGALMDLVADGDRNAVIFANKSINTDRGYGQKIQVEHKGNIEHNHNLVDLDQLRIPLKLRMELLHYIQKQEEREQGKLQDYSDVIEAEFIEKESA